MRALSRFAVFAAAIACWLQAPAAMAQEDAPHPLWLRYPAISPDGSRIAFTYRGQIWVVPANGGEATPLTGGPYYNSHPVWSPDSKRIAFSTDRHGNPDVFVMAAEGGPVTRLTHYGDNIAPIYSADIPMAFSRDGSRVYFRSPRLGDPKADAIDSHKGLGAPLIPQLYSVPASGGRLRMELPTPALDVNFSADGSRLLYTSMTSIENEWRKHHISDATRDIWLYDTKTGRHDKLTEWRGEDRDAHFAPQGDAFYWLSERSGSFNIWRRALDGGEPEQVTFHEKWPVRFLSGSKDGTLAYAWNGELWTLKPGNGEPQRVAVTIRQSNLVHGPSTRMVNKDATELAVSPGGGELAIVARGEVFVISLATGNTRRITSTPAAERFVSFSPDGRALLYASDRNGDWDIFETRLVRESDTGFAGAAPTEEHVLIDTDTASYQPKYSPDGKHIAYVEERTSLRVFDVETGESVEILPKDGAYSYHDGDMRFEWGPDSRWLTARTGFGDRQEVEILDATGREPPRNISLNGYTDGNPQISTDGTIVIWETDRHGLRSSHGSGQQQDIYGAFLTQAAHDAFKKTQASTDRPAGTAGATEAAGQADAEHGLPDLSGLAFRTERLTPFSSILQFFRLKPDNKQLVTVAIQPDGKAAAYIFDFATGSAKQLFARSATQIDVYATDKKVGTLYVLSRGQIVRYDLASGKGAPVPFKAEVTRDVRTEIEHIFNQSWRTTRNTFYRPDMQGKDWQGIGDHYRRFVPHMIYWEDLTELLSEMQGELDASHQGSRYQTVPATGDATARLGLYYDHGHEGEGAKIAAVVPGGPADRPDSALKPGAVILAVDGAPISANLSINQLLNRRAGQPLALTVRPAGGGETVLQIVEPITILEENNLAYKRWVAKRRTMVERLSNGRIGYIHVRGMGLVPYQEAYGELFGRFRDSKAVIVDIRSNGGGNLHDQLITMLTGSNDSNLVSRDGNLIISNPIGRYARPSVLLVNASSYSDASVFPVLYKVKGLGPIVGERVPGTGTAVSTVVELEAGIHYTVPELGFQLSDGRWFENMEIEPDMLVYNDPESVATGRDLQLEKAVEQLMQKISAN